MHPFAKQPSGVPPPARTKPDTASATKSRTIWLASTTGRDRVSLQLLPKGLPVSMRIGCREHVLAMAPVSI